MITNDLNKPLTISEQIKSVLFSIGINEKYISFDYLADFLERIVCKDFNSSLYNDTIELVADNHNITTRTAKQGIAKVIKMCNAPEVVNSLKFNLYTKSLFNKINVLKCYVEKHINFDSKLNIDETTQAV